MLPNSLKLALLALILMGCENIAPGRPALDENKAETVVVPVPVPPPEPVTSPLESDIAIDADFSPNEMSWILEAGLAWEQATEGRVSLRFHVRPVESGEPYSIARLDYLPGFDASYFGESSGVDQVMALATEAMTCQTLYYDISYEDIFLPVILHEIGHSLGLGHAEGQDAEKCVMYPNGVASAIYKIKYPQPCDLGLFNRMVAPH